MSSRLHSAVLRSKRKDRDNHPARSQWPVTWAEQLRGEDGSKGIDLQMKLMLETREMMQKGSEGVNAFRLGIGANQEPQIHVRRSWCGARGISDAADLTSRF